MLVLSPWLLHFNGHDWHRGKAKGEGAQTIYAKHIFTEKCAEKIVPKAYFVETSWVNALKSV